MWHFLFATGVENSYPTIDGGRIRHDQMESCGHYRHWRTDFELAKDLGVTRQYHDRYLLPVMHTETNMAEGAAGSEAVDWLWRQWASVLRVRNSGVPIVGFTWYSLTDQTDWNVALRRKDDTLHPVGLYDLDRNIRPVGRAYKELIQQWGEVLPVQSVCLQVPLVEPDETDEPWARRRREHLRRIRLRPQAAAAQA